MACFGLVKNGCEEIPILFSRALSKPLFGFNKYNQRIEITTRDITTGAKNATLKNIFPLRFLLTIKAIPRAAPSCTGIIQTTNFKVFKKLFIKIGSCAKRMKFCSPTNFLSSGVNR